MSVKAPPANDLRPAQPPDAEKWLDGLPHAVLGVEANGRIRYVNAAAVVLLGGAGGLLGRALGDVFGPDSVVAAVVAAAAERRGPVSAHDVVIEIAGLGAADLSAAPLEDGRFIALSVFVANSTHAARDMRPAPPIARTLAHEVRNPLAGIRAAAQLIGKGAGADADLAQLAQLIVEEADRIRRLTDRLDGLDGLAPPRLNAVNVHQALDRVRGLIAPMFPNVSLSEHFDPSLPELSADLDQLIQAFLNIAKNGAEAALSGPNREAAHLRISTAYRAGLRVRSGAGASARGALEVAFEDNGAGLPPDLQARVFEPFFTTKKGGVGLGLAVAMEIVRRHEGWIEADGRPGRTQFRVLLPFDRPNARNQKAAS
jgi:two-component system, NtrC family, nitrogen regulation sensor histidine kinase GlnL